MRDTGPEFGFGLYFHWPYCTRICPYCDFNVYAAKDRDTEPLVAAMIADLEAQRRRLPDHPEVDSVFFGGGTPSLLSPAQMALLLHKVNDAFGIASSAEITLEANPNDVLSANPKSWAEAGINRLSVGIQSLQDEALKFLGRDHDSTQARTAIDAAQSVFDNHSLDLIYARPGQLLKDWEAELTAMLALGAPHLSLYELTIEARTAFGHRAARGELMPMGDDEQADLYELTQAVCEAAGLPAYEVSNHARAPEFESRHNHIYWASGDWLGIGPGAHGRLTMNGNRIATEAPRRPSDYELNQKPEATPLSRTDTAREYVPMALRPVSGLDLERFERVVGVPPAPDVLEDLVSNGLAGINDNKLVLTVAGRLVADHIAALLIPYE
ncbi:MAG: radical SAM family heme chaperone HemW [Henriciella sp.]|nr:radical SAM family heme chaperone HemW [Henriciella sp.]MBO6695929.1 radical SAM family heme chaperone HemW [Henriciella sp.]